MKRVHVWVLWFVVSLVVATGLMLAGTPAEAANQNKYIFPPSSHPYGKSYGQWGKAWWLWAASFPQSINPCFDDGDVTHGDADDQPPGQVWFLAGTFGGSAERTLTVPPDKALVVPLMNWMVWNPEDCTWLLGDYDGCTTDELLAGLDQAVENPPPLSASLDDHEFASLTNYRARLGSPFTYDIVEDSLWGSDWWGGNYEPGERFPTLTDGYYIVLKPLDEGEHTLHFTTGDFLDVTYHLTVEPID